MSESLAVRRWPQKEAANDRLGNGTQLDETSRKPLQQQNENGPLLTCRRRRAPR